MQLPQGAVISPKKLTDYLLRARDDHDKSGLLAVAGYTNEHAARLELDIRTQLLPGVVGLDAGKSDWLDQVHHAISRRMKFSLFTRVAFAADVPPEGIRRGDVATVVEHHAAPSPGGEPGYSIEVFNALGKTIAVLTVPESHLEALRDDEVLSVQPWRTTVA